MRLIQHRPGYVLVIANAKGGVGKSLYTTNIAGELALRGYNVGIVDTDSQGNAALYLGMQPENGLFKALIGTPQADDSYTPVPLDQLVRPVPLDSYIAPDRNGNALTEVGGVYLLPGFKETYKIPYLLNDGEAFRDLLDSFIDQYGLDFVLVDTAPTLSLFDGSIYDAADGFLLVTECAPGSLAGMAECYERIERKNKRRMKRQERPSDLIGVIPNKYTSGREQALSYGSLKEVFGAKVFDVMKLYKTIDKACSYGQTVRANAAWSAPAAQMLATVDRIESALAEVIRVP